VLIYGSQMSDAAAVVVAWYPATRSIANATDFAAKLQVPVLMLVARRLYRARPDRQQSGLGQRH